MQHPAASCSPVQGWVSSDPSPEGHHVYAGPLYAASPRPAPCFQRLSSLSSQSQENVCCSQCPAKPLPFPAVQQGGTAVLGGTTQHLTRGCCEQDNRSLKEQNDELNGQIINLSIQGAKNLFSASFSESLAAEISSVSRDEVRARGAAALRPRLPGVPGASPSHPANRSPRGCVCVCVCLSAAALKARRLGQLPRRPQLQG